MEADFRNNKIDIKIAAPTFVIPFDQTNHESIQGSECWVFTMGDCSFESHRIDDATYMTHECY